MRTENFAKAVAATIADTAEQSESPAPQANREQNRVNNRQQSEHGERAAQPGQSQ